ncbi:MAG: hypothetical protein ABI605_13300 [Rhizobacter sp.]
MNNPTSSCTEASLPLNPMAQLWHAIAARWAAHLEETRKAREFDFTSDLSAETLRDIGAPEQMISNAAARREWQQQRLWDLRQWRGG